MTSTTTDTMLRISRIIAASQEEVFEAWTNPELVAKWSAPEGIVEIESEIDLNVGGSYTLKMINAEGGVHTAVGEYLEIDRPNKLVYTWDWIEDDHRMGVATIVNVEFSAVGEATEVTITHDLFPGKEATEGHLFGWISCIGRLVSMFE